MKITIIGSGHMAAGLAARLTVAEHWVQIHARNPAKAAVLAAKVDARVVDAAKAVSADVLIVATPWEAAAPALRALGDLSGRIVVDITNPLALDFSSLAIGHTTSAAEEIARAVPGARVVKAFNTIFAQVLQKGPEIAGVKVPVFVASDDAPAKETVLTLARSMGFAPVDAGPLKNARYLEPLGGLNVYFGYGAGLGTAIAPTWLFGP